MLEQRRFFVIAAAATICCAAPATLNADDAAAHDRFMTCERQLTFEGRRAGEAIFRRMAKR